MYRGFWGAMWNILRYYVLGLVGTFLFIAYLKRVGHDSANYYKVKLIATDGKAGYHHGLLIGQYNAIRRAQNEQNNNDVLGRSKIK